MLGLIFTFTCISGGREIRGKFTSHVRPINSRNPHSGLFCVGGMLESPFLTSDCRLSALFNFGSLVRGIVLDFFLMCYKLGLCKSSV